MFKNERHMEFEFIMDELDGLNVVTKPMFGARGVYVDGKIVFILRDRPTSPADNGVWLATTLEHHESLREDFPMMRSLELFGPGPTGWQNIPLDSDDFEEAVTKACRLVRAGDIRIGKIPKKALRRGRKVQKKVQKNARKKTQKKSTKKIGMKTATDTSKKKTSAKPSKKKKKTASLKPSRKSLLREKKR